FVLPGAIDAHVHAFSNSTHVEGFGGLTRAAAAGGVTTVIDMPYDSPEPVTTAELFRQKAEKIQRDAVAGVALYGRVARRGGGGRPHQRHRTALRFARAGDHRRAFPEKGGEDSAGRGGGRRAVRHGGQARRVGAGGAAGRGGRLRVQNVHVRNGSATLSGNPRRRADSGLSGNSRDRTRRGLSRGKRR